MKRIVHGGLMTFIFIMTICFSLKVTSAVVMKEEIVGIMNRYQGKIGNHENFNGNGNANKLDNFFIKDQDTNQILFCIQPGVNSYSSITYNASNQDALFKRCYNSKTSWQVKKKLVSRLTQLLSPQEQFDNNQVDRRIHFLALQTLIWEVMCEERDAAFNRMSLGDPYHTILSLMDFNHYTYQNRFYELYNDYVYIMQRLDKVPDKMSYDASKCQTVYLDQYDFSKNVYYTYVEDTSQILHWFNYSSELFHVERQGQKLYITCPNGGKAGYVIAKSNKMYGNLQNSSKEIIALTSGNLQGLVETVTTDKQNQPVYLRVESRNLEGHLEIDPNGGVYQGSSQKMTKTEIKGKMITISYPIKSGYRFAGWKLTGKGTLTNKTYTFDVGDGKLTAIWENEAPTIILPIVNNEGPFIDGENLIIQLGDPFYPLNHAKAWDKEDGDLTSKLKVIKDPVPKDQNQKTTVSGTYYVEYQVSDSGGKQASKKLQVIVNDPPVITGFDRYFFVGETIDKQVLLDQVTGEDKEDGNISDKIEVIQYPDSSKEGTFDVTYRLTDRYHKSVTKTYKVYINNEHYGSNQKELRYIGKNTLNTLNPDSKWLKVSELNQKLVTDLENEKSKYHYTWSQEENEQLKESILEQDGQAVFNEMNKYRKE